MNATTVVALGSETRESVSKADQAEASSAHARINIPLNLENWRALTEDVQADLLWFHQHLLDSKADMKEGAQALGYDESTLFRVLKGTYEGSWKNICGAIQSYRRITEERGTIQRNEFSENRLTKLVWSALSYALANNSVTLIEGESRMGKSMAAEAWRDKNNHGRSVLVRVPAIGGTKGLLRPIAAAVGVNKNLPVPQMFEAITRAFNKNRILILDEAHRLLPSDRRSNPTNLEAVRDIHDLSGCGLALIATSRFNAELRKSEYMFEQFLGRIGMPVRLPKQIIAPDIMPILRQYVPKPPQRLIDVCVQAANAQGRLGILVETLKVASRMAAKQKTNLSDEWVFRAFAHRDEMGGR